MVVAWTASDEPPGKQVRSRQEHASKALSRCFAFESFRCEMYAERNATNAANIEWRKLLQCALAKCGLRVAAAAAVSRVDQCGVGISPPRTLRERGCHVLARRAFQACA